MGVRMASHVAKGVNSRDGGYIAHAIAADARILVASPRAKGVAARDIRSLSCAAPLNSHESGLNTTRRAASH